MASTKLPRPGEKFGPCVDKFCGHHDCHETRTMAKQICPICGWHIGYNEPFMKNEDGDLVHVDCVIREEE